LLFKLIIVTELSNTKTNSYFMHFFKRLNWSLMKKDHSKTISQVINFVKPKKIQIMRLVWV